MTDWLGVPIVAWIWLCAIACIAIFCLIALPIEDTDTDDTPEERE